MTLQVRIWLSVLLVLIGAYGGYAGMRAYRALERDRGVVSVAQPIERTRSTGSLNTTDLVDTSGEAFDLAQMRGKVWLASFFFSTCPGPCAQMNRTIAGLQKELTDDDLKFVSITVDPDNDTPEVLAKYARTFLADPARWTFLSGPYEQVQRIAAESFQVPVGPKMHTERVILVDRGSNVRGLYLTGEPAQMIALRKKIKELLAEETPPPGAEKAPAETAEPDSATASADSAAPPAQSPSSSTAAAPAEAPQ